MYGTIINQSINQSIETLARYHSPHLLCVYSFLVFETKIHGTPPSKEHTAREGRLGEWIIDARTEI